MKSKKVFALLLVFAMVMATVILPTTASAAPVTPTLKLGDYVQIGEYYGQPILWRVVSFEKVSGYDDAGNPIIDSTQTKTEPTEGYLPLLLADKILTIKAFDAKGTITTGSHGRGYNSGYYRKQYGSNYWGDSNIRDWLNADTAEVNWSCGNRPDAAHMYNGYNAYDNESGFLYGFDNHDKSVIQPVTQKSLLDWYEYSYAENYHRYEDDIDEVVQNYANAYAEPITDKVFLLDVKQINTVYNNRETLGDSYYIGEPTAEAVANSDYESAALQTGKKWYSWLRSPHASSYYNGYRSDTSSFYTRCVDSAGDVSDGDASRDSRGVRPAFFLNLPAFTNFTGDGKSNNPYRFQKCTVTYQGDYIGSEAVPYGGDATLPTPPEGYEYYFTVNGEEWDGKHITSDVTVDVAVSGVYEVLRGGECGVEGVPTAQAAVKNEESATLRMVWQLNYDGPDPVTYGAYLFNWSAFDPGSADAENLCARYTKYIESGSTFAADIWNIPDTEFESVFHGIPFVNGKLYIDAQIDATVSDSRIN